MAHKTPQIELSTVPCTVTQWTEVSRDDLQVFSRQFAMLYASGIPILRCLEILRENCNSESLKETLFHVTSRIDDGTSLSLALRGFPNIFSPVFVGLVQAGEQSGSLEGMLERLATLLDRQNAFVRKLRAATIYPFFVASTSLAGLLFLLLFILPRVEEIFSSLHLRLPPMTLATIWLAKLVGHPITIACLSVGVFLLVTRVRPWLVRQRRLNADLDIALHQIPLTIPIVGRIITKVIGARLLQTLAILIDAGVPLDDGLNLCIKVVDNAALSEQLKDVRRSLRAGGQLSEALSLCEAFPGSAINLVAAGEEAAGRLTELLMLAARLQEEEAELTLSQIVMLLEPVILALVSFLVAFILVSTFLPLVALLQVG